MIPEISKLGSYNVRTQYSNNLFNLQKGKLNLINPYLEPVLYLTHYQQYFNPLFKSKFCFLELPLTAWKYHSALALAGVLCIQSVPIKCLRGKFCPTVIWPPMLCYEKVQNIENLVK